MQPETEQILAIIEVMISLSFCWGTEKQGEFNPWNMMTSEGFVSLTDLELAFKHWQNVERWGTPTDQNTFCEYAPPRSERMDDSWNEAIAIERQGYYQ